MPETVSDESLEACLDAVEVALKDLGLWQPDAAPLPEAFAGTLPFFMDTMELHQWLQFVLLPALRAAGETPLPGRVLVHPYAEEVYRGQWHEYAGLIAALRRLDRVCDKALAGRG